MVNKVKQFEAVGYMRASSATNVGEGKDSEPRQRRAIEGYAKSAGFVIVDWFYDKAVRGADAITESPGFAAMLDRVADNGVRTIIVESPARFARDLAVQLAGHDHLRKLGAALIPATAPDFFTEDTAVLVRQALGAIAQFDKATAVAKLRPARDRKIAAGEKCGGRKSYAEARPEMVELARQLRRPDPDRRPISLRKVAAPSPSAATSRQSAGHTKLRLWHRCSAHSRLSCTGFLIPTGLTSPGRYFGERAAAWGVRV